VLATYLGRDPAARVIAGHVRRGAVGRMTAVILYADLRGFTDFTDVAPPEEVTRRLNAYFDSAGAAIAAAGGEILKFLGDGILAVFLPPHGGDASAVADAAPGRGPHAPGRRRGAERRRSGGRSCQRCRSTSCCTPAT
jgi:adenylate cyclase